MSILNVEHLSHGFGDRAIFEDVSFSIDTNWKLGFIGRNGKGKSTFLNILLGKYEYDLIISKNRKDVIVNIKPQDIEVNYDSTPIYYQEKDITIFPENMSIVMPTISCAEYLSSKYSYITYENGLYNLTTNNYNNKLNHYFLYDGNDLYFFIEPVTLTVNGEKIKLSPLSYVIAKYNKSITYYDKEKDTFKTIETTDDKALIENDYYSINIEKDSLNYQGTNILLTSTIEKLNTIDKKD